MSKFFNNEMAELALQLALAPHRLRLKQIRGIETLLGMVEGSRSYPFELVCYHITGYHKRGPSTGHSIPGSALISDLVTLGEGLSRKASLPVGALKESCKTHQEVAEQLEVSTKTIRRWRSRGLMGLRVVYPDGVIRLAFLKSTVDRFIAKNQDVVSRGASFKQLTGAERDRIIDRARELVSLRPLKLHAAARVIAEETGRAVETIRYTLRRFDGANPTAALFVGGDGTRLPERYVAVARCHAAGDSVAEVARAFDCDQAEIRRVLRVVRVDEWRNRKWEGVHSELFDAPGADAIILDAPEPAGSDARLPAVPRDLPPYLQSLYATPLLTPDLERDLFRRYNYLKFKVARGLKGLDPEEIGESEFADIEALILRCNTVKQRIIQANLRLVVSIAKKHVGWSQNLFEVVSDGNVSLMRAMERFDFERGTKFSTYATWAIAKNYARTIPEQHYHGARYVTGQNELLHAAPDTSDVATSESDRVRIKELIQAGMTELTEREREIVNGHFGLGGTHGTLTLEQLGTRFGLTKERIRQIEFRALQRLREVLTPSLADTLGD